jgi:hypothetical protein
MKIEDNFLKQEKFDKIQNLIMGNTFVWYFTDGIDFPTRYPDGKEIYLEEEDKGKFQFTHVFYYAQTYVSEFSSELHPILETINPLSLLRIKANLLTKTPSIIENAFHVDIKFDTDSPKKLAQWTTSIFYVNTNNGYTEFEDGTKVENVANRMVTFPANIKHRGTSCTDEKTRVVINFNYYK